MYFVVYIRKLQKNVVLPATWIRDIDDHLEKFINYGINSSQKFLCYYTNNEAAFDDEMHSHPDFKPNFAARMIDEIDTDGQYDGCFIAKLKKFKRELQSQTILYTRSTYIIQYSMKTSLH